MHRRRKLGENVSNTLQDSVNNFLGRTHGPIGQKQYASGHTTLSADMNTFTTVLHYGS